MQVRFLLATTAATAAVGLLPISVQAATLFGTTGIEVDQPTIIRFNFSGAGPTVHFYQSNLSVYRVNGGVVDKTSAVPLFREFPSGSASAVGAFQDVTFLPGVTYTLGLQNFNPNNGTPGFSPFVFSTTALNTATNFGPGNVAGNSNPNINQQRALFGYTGTFTEGSAFPNPGSFTLGNPFAGPVTISFEDGGFDWNGTSITAANDRDFNDFRLTAQVIPAPPLLLGLLAIGARVISRQRKSARV